MYQPLAGKKKYLYSITKWKGFSIAQTTNTIDFLYKWKVFYSEANKNIAIGCTQQLYWIEEKYIDTPEEKKFFQKIQDLRNTGKSDYEIEGTMQKDSTDLYNRMTKRICLTRSMWSPSPIWKNWYMIDYPAFETLSHGFYNTKTGIWLPFWSIDGNITQKSVNSQGVFLLTVNHALSGIEEITLITNDGKVLWQYNSLSEVPQEIESFKLLDDRTIRIDLIKNPRYNQSKQSYDWEKEQKIIPIKLK